MQALLVLHRQLPLFRRHLFPQHFQISLHPRISRVPMQRLGKPAIGGGKIAAHAVPGRVHRAQQVCALAFDCRAPICRFLCARSQSSGTPRPYRYRSPSATSRSSKCRQGVGRRRLGADGFRRHRRRRRSRARPWRAGVGWLGGLGGHLRRRSGGAFAVGLAGIGCICRSGRAVWRLVGWFRGSRGVAAGRCRRAVPQPRAATASSGRGLCLGRRRIRGRLHRHDRSGGRGRIRSRNAEAAGAGWTG